MLKYFLFFFFVLYPFSLADDFRGKVALVTGGSSGIGYATSLLLAQKGAHVIFCARDSHPTWYNGSTAESQINSDSIVKITGGSARFFQADVRKIDQVRAFVNFAHQLYGHIDYAVNNAGVGGYNARLVDLKDEYILNDHDAILTNLYGVLISIREEAKYWYQHGNPNQTYSIIVIASEAGKVGFPNSSTYSASKWGVIGLVKSVALEFITTKPKIRINAICPGFVDTSLVRNQVKNYFGQQYWEGDYVDENSPLWPTFKAGLESSMPGKRMAQPEELANTIVGALDNANSFLNGAAISVDDGGA